MRIEKKKIQDPIVDLYLDSIHWAETPLLTIPKSYFPKKPQNKMAIDKCVARYTNYREIYEGTDKIENNENLFFKEISEFDFNDTLQSLAKLNYLLSEGYYRRNPEELIYIDQLFSGRLRKRLRDLWYRGRKIFFRQQMLALIKTSIVKNDKRKNKKLVGEDLESFGRVIFRVTDLTESDLFEKETRAKSKKQRKKIRLANLFRNIHFNSTQRFEYLLPRYWTIYFECIREAEQLYPDEIFPIAREFRKATGLDLELFVFLSFGLYAHYLKPEKSVLIKKPSRFLISDEYFRNLKTQVRKKARRIFSTLAYSKRGFKKEFELEDKKGGSFYFNFQPFWRKPFYKLNETTYFLLDLQYFQEKITLGIYGEINDYYLSHRKEVDNEEKRKIDKKRNTLNAFTGRCLEIYVKDLLRRLYSSRPLLASRLFSEIEGHSTGGVDFIVCYPDCLIFIEVTISGIRHNTVLNADLDKIEKEIKQIFFSAKNRKSKGKVVQLDDAINKFRNGRLNNLGIDPKMIKKIYPILILEKGIPVVPSMVSRYRGWIRKKGLLDAYVQDFVFIDLEELEMLETLISQGITLPDIIEDYKGSEYKDWPFKNFLYFERKGVSQNRFLNGQLSKMFKAMKKYFPRTDKSGLSLTDEGVKGK